MSALKKPYITEKMTILGEKDAKKQYAFEVNIDATKPQIKAEIEKMYDVDVISLRTMVVNGKKRSRFTRAGVIMGKSPNYKKAVVTLKGDQSIDFYKNI